MIKKENKTDIALFVQRIFVSAAFLYLTAGEALYFGEFVRNASLMGLPYPKLFCLLLIILSFICSILILTGILFRYANLLMAALAAGSGIIFFAGNMNKTAAAGSLLALALLAGFIISGPGAISFQYLAWKLKERKTQNRLPRH